MTSRYRVPLDERWPLEASRLQLIQKGLVEILAVDAFLPICDGLRQILRETTPPHEVDSGQAMEVAVCK